MFRFDLDINYSYVEEMATQSNNLHKALNDLNTAVNRINSIVNNNKGLAAEALKSKCPEITDKIAKIDVGAQKSVYLLTEFKDTMTGIIPPLSEGVNLKVSVRDSINTCNEMSYDLQNMVNMVSGLDTDVRDSLVADNTEAGKVEANKANKELERIKEQLVSIAKNIYNTYSDDIEKTRKKIEEYQQADSDFESKAESLYNDYADVGFWQTTTGKVVLCAGLVVVCVGLIVLGPYIAAAIPAISEAAIVGLGTWGLACGGIELAFGTVDSILNKNDIETGMLDGLKKGILVGGFTKGVGEATSVVGSKAVETLATKIPQYSQQINSYLPKAIEFGSDVMGETSGNIINNITNGEDVKVGKEIVNGIGNKAINIGGTKIKSEVVDSVRKIGSRNIVDKVFIKGEKIAIDYVEDGVSETYENFVDEAYKGKEVDPNELVNTDEKEIDSSHIERVTPEDFDATETINNKLLNLIRRRRN